MESDIKVRKKYKKVIWSLDNIPRFIIIEFSTKKLSPVYKLVITWNRPAKGIDNNILTIQISYSDIFHEEKKISIDRFRMESDELVKDVYNNLNKVIFIQGLMVESFDNKVLKKVNRYNRFILKYIDKKIQKKELKIQQKELKMKKNIKSINNFE